MRKFIIVLCAAFCLFIGGCEVQKEYYTISVSNLETGRIICVIKNVTSYQIDKARRGANTRTLNGHTSGKSGGISNFYILLSDDMAYAVIKQDDFWRG